MPNDHDPHSYVSERLFRSCVSLCYDNPHLLTPHETQLLRSILSSFLFDTRITRSKRNEAYAIISSPEIIAKRTYT